MFMFQNVAMATNWKMTLVFRKCFLIYVFSLKYLTLLTIYLTILDACLALGDLTVEIVS